MTVVEPRRVGLDDFNTVPAPADDEQWNGSWTPQNLADLPDRPPIQPTLGNVGLVYPGKRHVFSGPQESAKTLAAYAIGLEIVRAQGIVVLIDFEMGAWDARNRLRELGATDQELERFPYLEPHDPATPDTIRPLVALRPELVVVDAAAGAYDLQGLDDNKRADVERFTRLYVTEFWRAGTATIVLDHVVKNSELRGRYAIGSERKVGGADVHLGFEVITPIKRGASGLYKISTHKDRGGFLKRGTLANMELASDPDTHQITWAFKPVETEDEDHVFRPTKLMERVSMYLEQHPDGASRNEIETAVQGDNKYIRKAIDALIHDGHASEARGSRGARIVFSTTAYRDLVSTSFKRSQDATSDLVSHGETPNPDAQTQTDLVSDFVSSSSTSFKRRHDETADLAAPLQGHERASGDENDVTSFHRGQPPDDDPAYDAYLDTIATDDE